MKKFMTSLMALLAITISANAMSYDRAREQALFLTDKMAYELNLSEDQYEAAYEVNLDYLMSINSYDDLYGVYWRNRNLDLSYILLDWQYRAFCAASYFYRPLYWHSGAWHFGIYARYPRRNYFYFGRPHFYISYRGAHSWRSNGGRSWYNGKTYGRPHREGGHGMKDRFDRGDYRPKGHSGNNGGHDGRFGNNGNGRFGNNNGSLGNGNGRFGNGNRGVTGSKPSGNENDNKKPGNDSNRPGYGNNGNGRFGNSTIRNSGNRVSERESSTRSTVTRNGTVNGDRNNGSGIQTHSSSRNVTRPASTFTPQRSTTSGSMSSGRSHGTGNRFGGGSSHSTGSSRGGGGHFGGRR